MKSSMKKTAGVLLVMFLIACSTIVKKSGHAAKSESSEPGIQFPKYDEVVLDNGLHILFVPDERLPYVSYTFFFQIGSVHEPAGDQGLTQMTVRLLDKGTKRRTAQSISDRLASIAAPVSSVASTETSSVSASTLARFQADLVQELNEVVLTPSFPENEVARLREQMIAELQRLQDQPSALASYLFDSFLYAGHPYGQSAQGTIEAVKKLSRADVVKYYHQWFGPQNTYVAVVGQYTPALVSMIKDQLGKWRPAKLNWNQEIPVWIATKKETKTIRQPELSQAEIRVGAQGIPRNHPDYLALQVANTAFGGRSLGTRIMNRLRVELGLTYGAYANWDTRRKGGSFQVEFATRVEKADEAVAEVQRMMRELKDRGITAAEFERAKALSIGGFPWIVETPERYISQVLLLRHFGVDESYLKNYVQSVEQMTLAEVNSAIARHIDPENLRILLVTK